MLDRINLVPQKPLAGKIKRKLPLVLGLTLTLIVLAIQGQSHLLSQRINRLQKDIHTLEAAVASHSQIMTRLTIKKTEFTELTNQNSELETRVNRLEGMQQHKQRFSGLLAAIADALPPSMICRRIAFTRQTGEIAGEARGYEDLPDFVERLKNSGRFAEVSLAAINRTTRDSEMVFEFNITGRLSEQN